MLIKKKWVVVHANSQVSPNTYTYCTDEQPMYDELLAMPRMYFFEIGDFNEFEALLFSKKFVPNGTSTQRYYDFLRKFRFKLFFLCDYLKNTKMKDMAFPPVFSGIFPFLILFLILQTKNPHNHYWFSASYEDKYEVPGGFEPPSTVLQTGA